ncbi:hypothetical protein OIDMADRAFT_174476 [Oidiodendron maius Zn]|uniref:Uncharacterized protein n=1 Tax=Oidiodendron maius (strain Zn) TaxID=913774 RepID=A0A0C3HX55_OIDMZ|nr:hypothetical protein OIDMADRAFT_174476 [Oidiodendron maius Zn]
MMARELYKETGGPRQFTTAAFTVLAAVAMVEASCVPIFTCGMKRDITHPHAPVARDTDANNDFSNAFAGCLQKDNAVISQATPTSFKISGKNGDNFHDCTSIVNIYKSSGETHGKLVANADGSYTFSPLAADIPAWSAAVKKSS